MFAGSRTTVEISGPDFTVNGHLTYTPEAGFRDADPHLRGKLLMLKTANCIFDDARYGEWATKANPYFGYVHWEYPDGPWNPNRHTDEFIAALPTYRQLGLTMVYVNLMGNQPTGRGGSHPWINSAYTPTGDLKGPYMDRLSRVLEAADEAGMVIMIGLFYPQQDQNIMVQDTVDKDDALIRKCITNAVQFLVDSGKRNILIELGNESNHPLYEHWILRASRVHLAMDMVREASNGVFPISTGTFEVAELPDELYEQMDFLILNTPSGDPQRVKDQLDKAHQRTGGTKPILLKEDTSIFCMMTCLEQGASFALFHQGVNNYREGFQSIPVNWEINTVGKWQYFNQVARLTGSALPARPKDLPDVPPIKLIGIEDGQKLNDVGELSVRAELPDSAFNSEPPPLYLQRVEFLIDDHPVKYAAAPEPTLTGADLINAPLGFDARKLPPGRHRLLAVPYYIDHWITEEGPHYGTFRDRTGQVGQVSFYT